MRATRLAPFLILLSASFAIAATPPELFHKAKEQFRLRAYADCLGTLSTLEAQSREPQNENYRTALRPGLAFYRAAALAALGRDEEARAQFEIYLVFQPDVVLDPAIYPRKVIACLEETRRSLRQRTEPQEAAMASAYRAFLRSGSEKEEDLGEGWADGPVRWLITAEERRDYARLFDSVVRSEFVTTFWKTRDPRPETPANEFREEFEKRVQFADRYFTEDEVRGSLTDRGMAFILLGPPTYIGRRPIATGEDAADPAGMSRFTRNDVVAAVRGVDARASTLLYDYMTGPSTKVLDISGSWREIWHYRREILPKKVSYQQVDLEFITRKGYGKNVLQREDRVLNTLEAARKAIRVDKSNRRAS